MDAEVSDVKIEIDVAEEWHMLHRMSPSETELMDIKIKHEPTVSTCHTNPQRENDVFSKAFSSAQNLHMHRETHTGDKQYICDVCSRAFSRASSLKSHKRIHTETTMTSRQSSRLLIKREVQEPDATSSSPPPRSKKRKTGAESTREWKNRMKENNPDKYVDYLQKCRMASKVYRQKCTNEQKAMQREQSRLRMKAMRERKKEAQPKKQRKTRARQEAQPEKQRQTSSGQEEQRKQWREAKQKWWDSLHPQKQQHIKEKRSRRESEKRARKRGVVPAESPEVRVTFLWPAKHRNIFVSPRVLDIQTVSADMIINSDNNKNNSNVH